MIKYLTVVPICLQAFCRYYEIPQINQKDRQNFYNWMCEIFLQKNNKIVWVNLTEVNGK